MKKVIKTIINIVCTIVLLLLLAVEFLQLTHVIYIFEVKTGSMEVKIHVGDYIVVKKEKDYKVGDIITYDSNGILVTHRISKIDGDTFITKGDNNNTVDEPINKSDVVGKCLYKSDFLNFVIRYKYVLAIVLIIVFLITMFIDNDEKEPIEEEKHEDIEYNKEELEEEEEIKEPVEESTIENIEEISIGETTVEPIIEPVEEPIKEEPIVEKENNYNKTNNYNKNHNKNKKHKKNNYNNKKKN